MLGQFVLIIIIVILILLLCLRKSRSSRTENDASSVDRAEASMRDIENHHASSTAGGTSRSQPPSKRRREAASGSLNHRKLEEGDSVRAIQAILAAARDLPSAEGAEESKEDNTTKETLDSVDEAEEEGENSIVKSWRKVTDSVMNTIVGPPECTICLEPYQAGQTISWPRYGDCDHIFHRECLEEWLMKHDDCPLCRAGLVQGMTEP